MNAHKDSMFFSKEPLQEKVTVSKWGDSFYWELSIIDDEPNTNSTEIIGNRLAPYEEDSELIDCCDLEDNYEINPTKSGKYMTSFYVPVALQPVIIGPKGTKLKELQEATNTLIKVPKPDQAPMVKVTGPSERSVASARTQIMLLLLNKRERLPPTHFVSIPIYSEDIKRNFLKFKRNVLEDTARGVDASIFQRVEKFHLTIVTLALLDEKEIGEAKNLLHSCGNSFRKLFGNTSTRITLEGLEIMNDDPSNVDVLYGKVRLTNIEETEKFQVLADEILDAFYRNGIVRKTYENVKLHVTFMNSLFRRSNESNKEQGNARRESFDATRILERYKDFHFGTCNLDQIHLSIRFVNSSDNNYYRAATVLKL